MTTRVLHSVLQAPLLLRSVGSQLGCPAGHASPQNGTFQLLQLETPLQGSSPVGSCGEYPPHDTSGGRDAPAWNPTSTWLTARTTGW